MEINWDWLEHGYAEDPRALETPLVYRHVGGLNELQVWVYVERTGAVAVRVVRSEMDGQEPAIASGYLTGWSSLLRKIARGKDEYNALIAELPAERVFDDFRERIEEKYPAPQLLDFNHATFRVLINHFAAAEYLAARHFVAVVSGSGKVEYILRWNPRTGIWERNGAAYIAGALAKALPDSDFHKLINVNVVNNVKMALASVSSISVEEFSKTFNDYTKYLPVANGILDMDRRKLLPFSPEFRFTFKLAVRYDRKAKPRRIRRFIQEISGGKEDEENILRMIGYILVPKQPLQSFFILYGTGSNGKSTLVKVLRHWLGNDLVATRTLSDLLHNRFAFAELDGKLLNAATETPRGGHREVDRLKAVTGGDSVTVERKFQSAYFREMDTKLVFAANDLPDLPLDDVALFRRVVLIKFPHKFPKNPAFEQSLLTPEELSGLLNLALKYRRIVMEEGFLTGAAEEVRLEYMRRAKPLLAFAQEAIVDKLGSEIRPVALYLAFLRWCEQHGIESKYYISRAEWGKLRDEGRLNVQVASFVRSLEKEWKALHGAGFETDRVHGGSVIRNIALSPEIASLINEDEAATPTEEQREEVETIDITEDTSSVLKKVVMVAKNLQYEHDAFDVDMMVNEGRLYGLKRQDIEQAIPRLLNEGILQEVRPGVYRLVDGGVYGEGAD